MCWKYLPLDLTLISEPVLQWTELLNLTQSPFVLTFLYTHHSSCLRNHWSCPDHQAVSCFLLNHFVTFENLLSHFTIASLVPAIFQFPFIEKTIITRVLERLNYIGDLFTAHLDSPCGSHTVCCLHRLPPMVGSPQDSAATPRGLSGIFLSALLMSDVPVC